MFHARGATKAAAESRYGISGRRLGEKFQKESTMKNKHSNRNVSRVTGRRLALAFALCALTAAPLLSSTRAEQTSIQITNSSSVEIRHIYFSPVDTDNWGPDQLNQTVLRNGDSITLENAACTQGQI